MPQDIRDRLPTISPHVLPLFERRGINPFTDKFPVTLLAEGTIRDMGGLKIEDGDCQTAVAGLYAAGDAASRELVTGAISGGGSINSGWALSSGTWPGRAAARRARALGARADEHAEAVGQAGLRPRRGGRLDAMQVIATARWSFTAALHRRESRGMHARMDFPAMNEAYESRQMLIGLETIHSSFAHIAAGRELVA
jgi:succinate dehydrogenase/fumarate reductase flavoprotein subunit